MKYMEFVQRAVIEMIHKASTPDSAIKEAKRLADAMVAADLLPPEGWAGEE